MQILALNASEFILNNKKKNHNYLVSSVKDIKYFLEIV